MTCKFQKRHYVAIAEILYGSTIVDHEPIDNKKVDLDSLVRHLTVYFRNDNPLFDAEKFRKAVYGDK